jgi:hypothetical protein
MIDIDWENVYTHEEFKHIFRLMIDKSKKDLNKELD